MGAKKIAFFTRVVYICRMYSRSRLAQKYLRYYLTASNGRGHGIHSPFVYSFVKNVLNDSRLFPAYARVEEMRTRLLKDQTKIEIEDLGAGSVSDAGRNPGKGSGLGAGSVKDGGPASGKIKYGGISQLATHAAKPRKLGQLLFRIAHYYQPRMILELGTSLGLSTSYLAYAAPGARVLTIEGAPAIAREAEKNFREQGLKNIELVTGNFDEWVPFLLGKIPGVDLAFIDGNHRREATLRYFNLLMEHAATPAVLIFDDIHWSREMEQAWEAIKGDTRVILTIDLFFIGMVFLREEFTVKQDFVIRY
jgi:predicted O-methyltransferase YrrM